MFKRISLSVIMVLILILSTSCDKNSEPSEEVDTRKVTIIDLESNTRPFAITVNNYPSAVKVQTGLSKAYLIYEFPVESGLSRSLAFFKDVFPEKIGTVRSARHNFLDYIMENDAIFVHYGWSTYAKNQISQLGINNIDGNTSDPEPFWRENPANLAWEHRVYASLVKAKQTAIKKGYSLTSDKKAVLNYSVDEITLNDIEGNVVANEVIVPYSGSYSVTFKFNSEDNRYYRYVNGKAHTDYFTKEHYSFKNVIVVRYGYKMAANGKNLDLHNIGTGEGYYITNGYAVPITWVKENRSSQTIYKYKDGTEIKVNDGNTYIMNQLTTKKLTIK